MVAQAPQRVGRYVLHRAIGAGGMATVHFGRLDGVAGFARVVAIKRLHPHIADNRELAARVFDEARLAARVRHVNVVSTLDVALDGDAGLVVMEYVQGEALGRLLQVACRADDPPPARVASAIVIGVLHGLQAAHDAEGPAGEPLGIVHRDVSPQNVLVGSDGVPRLLDFGIAKAAAEAGSTPGLAPQGKAAYMAPEQLRGRAVTASADVFSASIVLWEALVGRRLFLDETEAKTLHNVLEMSVPPPSAFVPGLSAELDRVVLRGLARDPSARFASARAMADALEQAEPPASAAEVGGWVHGLASEALAARAAALREVEAWSPGAIEAPSEAAPAPRARRVARLAWAALGALVMSGGGAAVALAFRGPAPNVARAPERVIVEAPPLPPPPAPSAVAAAAAEPAPIPSARVERVLGKRGAPARAPAAKPQCSPPYSYNAAGHKVFKPECL